jgi:hypothetical protein
MGIDADRTHCVPSTLDGKPPKRGKRGPRWRLGAMGLTQTREVAAQVRDFRTDQLRVHCRAHGPRAGRQGPEKAGPEGKDQKGRIDSLVKAMVTATEGELATAGRDSRFVANQSRQPQELSDPAAHRPRLRRADAPWPHEGPRGQKIPRTTTPQAASRHPSGST